MEKPSSGECVGSTDANSSSLHTVTIIASESTIGEDRRGTLHWALARRSTWRDRWLRVELRRRWGFHHADGNPVGVVNAEDADADKAFVRMQVPSASRFELRVPVITYCDGGTCIERGQNLPIGATCIGPRRTCIHLYTSHDNRILSTNSAPPEAAFGVTAARLGRWSSAIPKYSEMADISRRTTSSIALPHVGGEGNL